MAKSLEARLEALEAKTVDDCPIMSVRFVVAADGRFKPFRRVRAGDGRSWELRDGETQADLLERAKADARASKKVAVLLCMD